MKMFTAVKAKPAIQVDEKKLYKTKKKKRTGGGFDIRSKDAMTQSMQNFRPVDKKAN